MLRCKQAGAIGVWWLTGEVRSVVCGVEYGMRCGGRFHASLQGNARA